MSIIQKVQAAGFEGIYRPLPAARFKAFREDLQEALSVYFDSKKLAQDFVLPKDYSQFLAGIPAYINRGKWHNLYSHRELLGDLESYMDFFSESLLAEKPLFWLKIGWQGARDNFWLCADKASSQWAQVVVSEQMPWEKGFGAVRYPSFEAYVEQFIEG